jgi:hypothetical protein
MSPPDERRTDDQREEEVGAVDPRRGPIPTEAPEDESGVDTRDLESDKKQVDENGQPQALRFHILKLPFPNSALTHRSCFQAIA